MSFDSVLSSEAKYLLATLNEDSIIDPDDYTFFLSGGIRSNPQFTRTLVRDPLVEVNSYKPGFLSTHIKRDFNLLRVIDKNGLAPTEFELKRLKEKLLNLYKTYWPIGGRGDIDYPPQYGIKNNVISSWMIEKQDVFDFLDGVSIEEIFYRMKQKQFKLDKPFNLDHN